MFIDTNFESPRSTISIASVVSNSGSSSDDSSSGYSSATTLKSCPDIALSRAARLPLNHRIERELCLSKEKYLNYLGLDPAGRNVKKKKIIRPKPSSYEKFLKVDISSPLGKLIIRTGEIGPNDRLDINATQTVVPERKGLRSEAAGNLCTLDDKDEDFPITYFKRDRSEAAKCDPHQYCFNNLQRRIRLQVLEQGNAFVLISRIGAGYTGGF